MRLLLLHGFMGTGADWDGVRAHLGETVAEADVCAPDLPGHGLAVGLAPAAYTMDGAADRLVAGAGPGALVVAGYSMGGRLALHLALRHPGRVAALVLVSASPGLRTEAERDARRRLDAERAAALCSDFAGFLDAWYRAPLWGGLGDVLRERLARRRLGNDPAELASSLDGMGTGAQPSHWSDLAALAPPTWALAGADDAKYVGVVRDMARLGRSVRAVVIPGAGHALLDQAPEAVAGALAEALGSNARPVAFPPLTDSRSPQTMPTKTHHNTDRPIVDGPFQWEGVGEFEDILYEKGAAGTNTEGIARVTINRPEVRNAFRPTTVTEMIRAIDDARDDPSIGVFVITGAGDQAFCSGGDQRIRGDHGYREMENGQETGMQRLNVLDFQTRIRKMPKPVIASVNGWAVGGGHVLHVVCDLTIASDNARFMQTGPKVGSFDAGYGTSHLARIVGQKKAREIWFLCRPYSAQEALDMGLVNTVVPLAELERETVQWCREILANSNIAIRMIKAAANADEDGGAGLQELAGHATMLFYMTEEGQEGKNAYLERRPPAFDADGYRP